MLNYALRRILVAIVLVWVVATIIFSLLPGTESWQLGLLATNSPLSCSSVCQRSPI